MKCLHPYTIYREKTIDSRPYLQFPCGKCIACRINYTRQWTQRLVDEIKFSDNAYFLTLTYDDEHLPVDVDSGLVGVVCKRDVQLFFKRLRKFYPDNNIRYFLGSEYGSEDKSYRPHYHAIVFNLPEEVLEPLPDAPFLFTNGSMANRKLNKIWKNGFVTIGYPYRERISYCAKYFIDKNDVQEGYVKNFTLMSRRPGIGFQRIDDIKDKVRYYKSNMLISDLGTYVGLPRYYRRHIYSDEERSQQFEEYKANLLTPVAEKELDEYLKYLDNSSIIENNIIRSKTWKGKKQKQI